VITVCLIFFISSGLFSGIENAYSLRMSLEKKYYINENESMPFNPTDIDQMI
jgi:hypothetical protein